ncbi:MAG: hypothetical protein H6644_21295 [Caldilineaceae bacterium]|nr:hypothetical protein [Caldilineaceae bacterium]
MQTIIAMRQRHRHKRELVIWLVRSAGAINIATLGRDRVYDQQGCCAFIFSSRRSPGGPGGAAPSAVKGIPGFGGGSGWQACAATSS